MEAVFPSRTKIGFTKLVATLTLFKKELNMTVNIKILFVRGTDGMKMG
jgi:hypothetical protein